MSAQKLKPSGVLGGILGLVGFSVLAGVLVTAMVTPALAVTSSTAQGTINIFENLPDSIRIGTPSQQNQIFAMRDGKPVQIATIYKQNRQVVGWDDVSPLLKQAAVDGEDRRFYDHGGVDVPSIARAVIKNNTSSSTSGSSTIDMQLVKNIRVQDAFIATYPGTLAEQAAARAAAIKKANGFDIARKLQEMKLAIGLDKSYTKQQILLGYLNIVGMGTTTYGVEAAALQYFSVHAKDVTLPEAASLMATVQNPLFQSVADPKNYPRNKIRRDEILASMLSAGHITQKQHDDAVATPIASYVKLSLPDNGCRTASDPAAAAACDYALRVILAPKLPVSLGAVPVVSALGDTPAERLTNWNKGGYKIYTTIDLGLQDAADALLKQQAPPSEARLRLGATADTVQVGTGNILVMAQNLAFDDAAPNGTQGATGFNLSVDYPYGGTNGYDTGSTFKIFDLANWLQTGHSLGDIVNGSEQTYRASQFTASCDPTSLDGVPNFKQVNDQGSGGGYMSVKTGLVESVNNAFMQMATKQDFCKIRDTAVSMGAHLGSFKGPLAINPAFILGTNAQAPLTMAAAAATIGGGGLHCLPIIIASVTDPAGKTLPGQTQTCNQALTPEVAAGVANAMVASMTLSYGTSHPGNPNDGIAIGGKTGTSSSRDQDWVTGTTTKLATTVWTGNWDSKQISLKSFTNPVTRLNYYLYSRFNVLKGLMKAADVTYPGAKSFPTATNQILNGSSYSVPSVTGQTSSQAQQVLQSFGFQYQDGGTVASSLPSGRVVSTDPAGGSRVSAGTTVNVYTSDGSLATVVPNVVGSSRQAADAALQSSGFAANNITYNFVAGSPAPGQSNSMCVVQASNPSAGSAAAKTDSVALTVYGKPDGSDPGGGKCPQ